MVLGISSVPGESTALAPMRSSRSSAFFPAITIYFKSTSQALDCYQSFCDETKGKEIAHSEDVVSVLKEWEEVRDTVLSFLQKDSAYYALSFK